jgi:hypothetical protein
MLTSSLFRVRRTSARLVLAASLAAVALVGCPAVQAAPSVHFDKTSYNVTPGGTLAVQVLLDMDPAQAGDQPVAGGLLSMGVKITFDGGKANVSDVSNIVLPESLQDDGAGGPPLKEVAIGSARAFGSQNIFTTTEGYASTLLATFNVSDLGPQGDSYTLTLARYSSSPTFSNFVDWAGNAFDSQLSFGSATVNVVPEPVSLVLFGIGGLLLARRRVRVI